jgi:hypothetical protein
MNIEAFLLCDAATDQQGKLNILGAFDSLFVPQVPTEHPACAVAVRIRFEKIEEGNHKIRLQIIDEDGNSIGPKPEANISVRPYPGLNSYIVNLVFNIQGLEFKKYGEYRIDLAIDGQIKGSLPLTVREVPRQ